MKQRNWQPMFDGKLGLKQGYALTNMPPGSLLDVKNMYLNGIGGKAPRGGYTELFHLTDGGGARITDRIRSLIQYQPYGGTAQVLAYSGTEIHKQNGSTSTAIRTTLSNDVPWEWIQYANFVLGVNGLDTSFLWNGTTYSTISITPPSANVTYSDVGGGSLNAGNYQYLVTFYDSTTDRESNPALYPATSPAIIAVGASGKVTITTFPAPVAGEGVDSYRIYRKRASETLFTFLVTLPIATTTYDDNDNTTSSIYMDYDTGANDSGNTPHPQSKLICEQFDRIFMVDENDPTILAYSKVGNYWAFPSGNYFYVGRGDGSRIIRIEKHGKALLIHKENGWYILEGDPSNNSPRLLSKVGTQDVRTSVSAHNQVVRLGTTGFYKSVPTDYSTTDLREDYIGSDIADYESQLDWSNAYLATMFNYNTSNRRHVYYIDPKPSSYYSDCFVYDIVLEQWVYYQIGTDVYSETIYVANDKQWMIFGDGYGIVWKWDDGAADGKNLIYTLLNGTATSADATHLTDLDIVDVLGTATGAGSGADTLADTTKIWTVNQWVNKPVYIVSGTGAGQTNVVSTNTVNELKCTNVWSTPPDATSVYTIGGWVPDELIGIVISTWEGTGGLQRRRIIANDSYSVTIDSAWGTTPDSTTTFSIGCIEKLAEEYWDSNGDPHLWKRMRWIVPYIRQTGNFEVEVSMRRDFRRGYDDTQTLNINIASSESLWGFFIWGVDTWESQTSNLSRMRLHGKYHYYSIKYRNRFAGEPFFWDGHGAVFQVLYDRNK